MNALVEDIDITVEVDRILRTPEHSTGFVNTIARWIARVPEGDAARGALVVLPRSRTGAPTRSHSGTYPLVPGGADADFLLLISPDRLTFRVDLRNGVGVRRQPVEDIGSNDAATIVLTDAPVAMVPAAILTEELRSVISLLVAASLLSASRAAYALTKAHVQTREQFGKPLVAMPTVAGNLARMHVGDLQATAALERALDLLGAEATAVQTFVAARIAKIAASEAATETARLAHQLHGATGIRQDYPLAQLTRFIWSVRDLYGSIDDELEELGRLVRTRGETAFWEEFTRPS